jgi:hypothetical protein
MRMALSAFVVAVAICGAAYAQQGRSCSDVAANAKQTCSSSVRRQGFRDNGLSKLREALAHRVGEVRRPAAGAASGD